MTLDIQARGFELSPSLESYIHKKALSALRHSKSRVRKIVVRLFNEDATYNKKARTCRIQISLNGLPDLVANHRSTNIYKASNQAMRSISFTIKNKLKKRRKILRRSTFNLAN